ncbi:hypothetical protein [Paraferrimonas sp. SM1919]|uniref:hypothetical protein n=1 Tax=Paraferrimonas sp. SM1919 TaxID=2662263 RepID=UPI0013D5F43E|nr:hypothetical protein [Paraferrimonas sp. SM1919]
MSNYINDISCAEFIDFSEEQKRSYILGFCHGRYFTLSLLIKYARQAAGPTVNDAESLDYIDKLTNIIEYVQPLVEMPESPLLKGLTALCTQDELQHQPISKAFFIMTAYVAHLDHY